MVAMGKSSRSEFNDCIVVTSGEKYCLFGSENNTHVKADYFLSCLHGSEISKLIMP
jgi:hypothetical protein